MTCRHTPALAALAVSTLAAMGCQITIGNHEAGSVTRTVSTFDSVEADNGVEVDLTIDPTIEPEQASDVELDVSGETNLLSHIETDVVDGTLVVDVDGAVSAHLPLEVAATVADIRYAGADNGAEVTVDGIDRDTFDIQSDNGAEVRAVGTAHDLFVTVDNGADSNTRELTAEAVDVDIDNGGSAVVCATSKVTGVVDNGANLVVHCGGDTSGVSTKNGGSVD